MPSAIAGDPKRGIGILNNELYIGRVLFNRFRWVRSASDSSRRRCLENPLSEWIVYGDERLRVVPQALWKRVKARQKSRSEGTRSEKATSSPCAAVRAESPSICSADYSGVGYVGPDS